MGLLGKHLAGGRDSSREVKPKVLHCPLVASCYIASSMFADRTRQMFLKDGF